MTQSFSSGSTIFGDTLDDTHQFTGSVDITGSLTVDGITYPTTDGDNGDVLITDGAGNLSFTRTTVYANVKNVHGSELVKGMPVHVTGAAGNTSEVVAASASNAATMPAHFILNETLADDAEGLAIAVGYINGVNTGDFDEGDTVYVAADGGYTNVKPTGSNLIQNLGIVDKVDATNGSGFILGAGRSNDVPNITSGYAWVGNSDQVATAVATSSFLVDTASLANEVAFTNITGKPTLISSSAQIDHDSTTNFSADEHFTQANITTVGTVTSGDVSAILPAGTISSSAQVTITENQISDLDHYTDSDVKTKLNTENVVSGSASSVRTFLNVEDGADVTDTTNVTAAGALMDSEVTSLSLIKGLTATQISGAFDAASASLAADIPTNNNQLTNGAGYTTNTGTVDTTGTPANNQLAVFTDSNTIEGDSDLTWNGSIFTINGAGSLDVSTSITGSALQLGNLGAENEILIVGANTEVTSSNLLAIDTVNERVGIGTSTPQVKLDLVGESSGEAQVRVAQHDDTSDGPDIRFFKSHGTAAASSSVANDDYIGAVNAFAYDGSTYIQSGFFGFQADGTDGDSKFGLRTRVDGTLTDRITVDAAGDVNIAGNISASGDIIGATGSFDVIFGGTF